MFTELSARETLGIDIITRFLNKIMVFFSFACRFMEDYNTATFPSKK